MALQKTIMLANSASGNYIRIDSYRWDRVAREASAHLSLFVDEAAAISAPTAPLCMIAKLRLTGDKFDDYLSTAELDALVSPGPDPVRDQLYHAAKTETLLAGGGLTSVDLSDATDV